MVLPALEALWVGAWLAWLTALGATGLPGTGALVALAAAAAALAWGLQAARVTSGPARAISLAAGLALILVLVHAGAYPRAPLLSAGWLADYGGALLDPGGGRWLLTAVLAALWWRATRSATERHAVDSVRRAAAVGLAALALLAVVAHLTVPVDLGRVLAVGTVGVLVALALAQLDEASLGVEGAGAAVGGHWPWLVLAALGLVGLLVGLLTLGVSLLRPEPLLAVFAPLGILVRDLALAIFGLLFDLVYGLIAGLLQAIMRLWELVLGRSVEPFELLPEEPALGGPEAVAGSPDWLRWLIRLGLLGLLVLGLGWLLSGFRRYNERPDVPQPVERSSGLSFGRLWADALGLVKAAAAAAVAAGRGTARPRGVRALYARVLAQAAALGRPRPAAATPYEHRPAVEAALPGAEQAVARLTEAYVAARYGDREPPAATLRDLEADLRRIQTGSSER
jgi:hypothetical protein